VLRPRQWPRLIDRLDEIENPVVPGASPGRPGRPGSAAR
jgi:hypothetical protein